MACIAGLRTRWIRLWKINVSRSLPLATRTKSTGHFAGERTSVASSDYLWAITNRMCPAVIRMLWWPRIAAEFHGVSSQTRRIRTTKKGVSSDYEEVRVWRTALSISSGSYSGLAIHEPV